ncbi:MAG: hypothetical protein ACI4DO_07170 [Roseburia sp.]
MIIQSGNVGMTSSRSYASVRSSSASLSLWGSNGSVAARAATTDTVTGNSGESSLPSSGNDSFSDSMEQLIEKYKNTQAVSSSRVNNALDSIHKMQAQIFEYLLYWLFGGKMPTADGTSLVQSGTDLSQEFGGSYDSEEFMYEAEATSFSTKGTVVTSDGRSIDFQIDVAMSRSFTSYASEHWDFGAPRMTDPLVINLDTPAACVSDQKFYFDLDADGHEEYISMLTGGSGYLALDKNNDGTINDGSELFGTSSGDGFADLAAYDSDGNGWIDEADPIFNQLLIWRKNADGSDSLCGIGQAGIGAIYLGSTNTEFSLNSLQDNQVNANIRRTGIFLYENGGAGTIQHVDLAQ